VPRGLRQARDLTTARRICGHGEQIFAEQGLAGARMDEIARAAKVNKALLYYYFRSKEELFRFVLETLLSQLRTGVVAQHAIQTSPSKRLAAVIDNFFELRSGASELSASGAARHDGPRTNSNGSSSEYYKPLHVRLVGLIEQGIFRRRIPARGHAEYRADRVSIMVFTFSAAPVLSRILGHDPLQPREVAHAAKPSTISSNTGYSSLGQARDEDLQILCICRRIVRRGSGHLLCDDAAVNRNPIDGHRHGNGRDRQPAYSRDA